MNLEDVEYHAHDNDHDKQLWRSLQRRLRPMPILNNAARYEMRIDGYKLSYTSTGLVVDHLTARVRGCAVQIDDRDVFCDHLRQLKRGETVLLNLRSSNGEVDYNGEAEAVLIRERFSRRAAPAVTFIFRMLKYRVPSGT